MIYTTEPSLNIFSGFGFLFFIWTHWEHLPSSARILQPLSFYFAFLNRTKPGSPTKSLVNSQVSHQFLIKILHRPSNLMLIIIWNWSNEHQKWMKAPSAEYWEKQECLSFCLSTDSVLVVNSLFARACRFDCHHPTGFYLNLSVAHYYILKWR